MNRAIESLKIKNFKNFADIDIKFNDYSVIIGQNASGKSNLISALVFFQKLAERGFKYAVLSMGNYKYIKPFETISQVTDFTIAGIMPLIFVNDKETTNYKSLQYEYAISIFNYRQDHPPRIEKESLYFYARNGELILSIERAKTGKIKVSGKSKNELIVKRLMDLPVQSALLEFPFSLYLFTFKEFLANELQYFDFIPEKIRAPALVSAPDVLEKDGANLAKIIRRILSNQNLEREFNAYLQTVFDFVVGINIREIYNSELVINVNERFTKKQSVPAFSISAGTLNILAIITALFFEEGKILVIEEPERSLHPSLMLKVLELIKEASKNKQIIITTHDPNLAAYADLDSILIIRREKTGYSVVSHPNDEELLKIFLDNELNIGDLMISKQV